MINKKATNGVRLSQNKGFFMKIGIPTETKAAEKRVALIPNDCKMLTGQGLEVYIQSGAGVGAGFDDSAYIEAGCIISKDVDELYEKGELIVKVKEPLAGDLLRLKKNHTLFCYLHLASAPTLVNKLKDIGLTAIAFETVVEGGKTPLLSPMSAIAGRLSIQLGTRFLHAPEGGRGTLLGGIDGTDKGNVVIIGAGVAGQEAMKLALGMGANVTISDINEHRLTELKDKYPKLNIAISTPHTLLDLMPKCDLLVGAVYVVGRKAPHVITRAMVENMPKKAVLVDISIDQGGCAQTSKPCTHEKPTYEEHGIIHSAITNLPAAAPRTASQALSNVIARYVERLAYGKWSASLKEAINVSEGQLKIEL